MCGLAGIAGYITIKEEQAFRDLLILDQLRGGDSTGTLFVTKEKMPLIAKAVGNPAELFDNQLFENGMRRVNRVLLGHNRFATQGGVTKYNAHPFECGHIFGAHNGTLKTRRGLDQSLYNQVDSRHIYNSIEANGDMAVLPNLDGAYALTWWDSEAERLCFARNEERPLYLALTKDKKSLIWASEEWMVEVAASRNKIAIEKPALLPTHVRVAVSINFLEAAKEDLKFSLQQYEPYKAPIAAVTPPSTKSAYTGLLGKKVRGLVLSVESDLVRGAYLKVKLTNEYTAHPCRVYINRKEALADYVGSEVEGFISGSITEDGKYIYKISPNDLVQVESVESVDEDGVVYVKYGGAEITLDEFKERTKDGCAWCSCNLEPDTTVVSTTGSQPFCKDCAKDPEIANYVSFK